MKLVWDESTWDDYVWWQQQDRKVLKRINTLITDIQRNGNEGIGKPEPLKHGFQGYWSRRITDEHRLVYKVIDDEIRIAACRYHYERLPKPSSLEDLRAPAAGEVELPLHVAWSGRRVYDLSQEDQRLVLYALLLAEAQREDLERFVHRESLVSMWPRLRRLLGPHARREWERQLITPAPR